MSMTWAQIYRYALIACGESSAFTDEGWDHVSEGYRRVCSLPQVDVPELITTSLITISANPVNDFWELDAAVFYLASMLNVTDGYPVRPEPGGMIGRMNFMTTTGLPSPGNLVFYWRDGNRVYFRDLPTHDTVLKYRWGIDVPNVDVTMVNSHPITPPEYDWSIVHAAVTNYLGAHPDEGGAPAGPAPVEPGQRQLTRYQMADKRFTESIQQPRQVFAEENKAQFYASRLGGYGGMSMGRRAGRR